MDEQGARRRPGQAPWLRHSGRLRRVPDDDQLPGLQADYDAMRAAAIIADDAPGFDVLVDRIRILEASANGSG